MTERLLRARSLRTLRQSINGRNLVQIDVQDHTTRSALEYRMLEARNTGRGYHIIHFIGHGASDEQGGFLFLEQSPTNESGSIPIDGAYRLAADEFAGIVAQPTVNLVVLNACQSAVGLDVFNGVAEAVLRRGIPAVVGMQVKVLDQTAVEFAQEFYGALALGEPIESALAFARRLIIQATRGAAIDWGIPVLYMIPIEGLRLSLPKSVQPSALRQVLQWATWVMATGLPLLFFYFSLLPPEPIPMTKLFNVAVADFGVVNIATSEPQASDDGQLLAEMAFTKFDARLKQFDDLAGDVDIQHEYIRFIPGATAEERQQEAAILAEKLNADIVIYGNIDASRLPNRLIPEFYVSPRLTGAEESTGPNAFGTPLDVRLPLANNSINRASLNERFVPRLEALTEFMFGLAYYKADIPEKALEQLTRARKVDAWSDTPGQGKEILYLWIGTTHIKRALQDDSVLTPCPSIDVEAANDWTCALMAYEKALSLNNRFARAYVGLGKVWADQAKRTQLGIEIIDCSAYLLAVKNYQQAFSEGMEAAETAIVNIKVHFNTGLAYASAFRNGCGDEYFDPALENLGKAVKAYEENPSMPLVRELGARTYYQLGITNALVEDYPAALYAFDQVVTIADPKSNLQVDQWEAIRWNLELGIAHARTGNYQAMFDSVVRIVIFDPTIDLQDDPWQSIRWSAHVQRGAALEKYAGTNDATLLQDTLDVYKLVVDYYERGNDLEPAVICSAYYGIGSIYNRLNEPLMAVDLLMTSISLVEQGTSDQQSALSPLPWTAYVALGDAYLMLSSEDEAYWRDALSAYEYVVTQFESNAGIDGFTMAKAYFGSGQVYEAQQNYAAAEDNYRKALALPAIDPETEERVQERLRALQSSSVVPQQPIAGYHD